MRQRRPLAAWLSSGVASALSWFVLLAPGCGGKVVGDLDADSGAGSNWGSSFDSGLGAGMGAGAGAGSSAGLHDGIGMPSGAGAGTSLMTHDAATGPIACPPGRAVCRDCNGVSFCWSSSTCPANPCGTAWQPVGGCPEGDPTSCYVDLQCPEGASTTLTGRVYDPAGRVPVYHAVVYVSEHPSSLPTITTGTNTCVPCGGAVVDYVAATATDIEGFFTLSGVPTLDNLPVVIQSGKWRRAITVPHVANCGTTAIPDGQARLPRNQSEGDMPQMALLTGGDDDLGCFLTRVGIDPSEFGPPHSAGGTGRVDVYQGLSGAGSAPALSNGAAGDCTNDDCPLWSSKQALENYDVVVLACQGDTFDGESASDGASRPANVTAAAKQVMHDWLDEGGYVFATHFQYTWFQTGPTDFQSIANWLGPSAATGTCDNCTIDTSFPNGALMSQVLSGDLNRNHTITLDNVADSVSSVNAPGTRWIFGASGPAAGATDPKYLSFPTPIEGIRTSSGATIEYCGKVTFADLHVSGAPSGSVPGSCTMTDLTPQEKALEFMLFDTTLCAAPTRQLPIPPP